MRPVSWIILAALALAAPGAQAAPSVQVGPGPASDRLFPYLVPGTAFGGTPLAQEQVLVPGPVIVYDADAAATLAPAAGQLAFMLGQLAQSPTLTRQQVASRSYEPVMTDDQHLGALRTTRPLIVLGRTGALLQQLRTKLPTDFARRGPAIHVVPDALAPGLPVMVVSGPTDEDVVQATSYLANERLHLRAGAYDGFFAFVRLRTYLEKSEWFAASELLDDPRQLKGCAKGVTVQSTRMAQMPAGVPELATRRNQLVFRDLRAALGKQDRPGAIGIWQEAMQTCYACHAGRGGTRVLPFTRVSYPHRLHQDLATRAGMTCVQCHQGPTEQLGYAP